MTEFPVSSFDVFDTTLVRLVGTPTSLFTVLGYVLRQRGVLEESPEKFRRLRVEAELGASDRLRRQVRYEEIHEELRRLSGWPERTCALVKAAELEWEEKLIRPVRPVLERIARARETSPFIVFASDMYLPGAVVENLLRVHRALLPGDCCFVSSESLKTKASGALFEHITTTLERPAGRFVHCGDNPHADGASARRAGFGSVLVTETALNRYETILEQGAASTSGYSSVLAGISRKIRLDRGGDAPSAVLDVAAGVAAPLLVEYVDWCLREAEAAGLERLCFASRDGQVLLRIAQALLPVSPFRGKLAYLYGGRCAWLIPSIERMDKEGFEALAASADWIASASVLRHFGIEAEGPMTQETFRERATSADAAAAIVACARKERGRLVAYLRQLGIGPQTRWGFVETGWRGRLQAGLHRVLSGAGLAEPLGLYLGLAPRESTAAVLRQRCFLYDGNRSSELLELQSFLSTPVEVFCAADHAPVVGFTEAPDGRIGARYAFAGAPPNAPWSPALADTVVAFAECLAELGELSPLRSAVDTRPLLAELVTRFWREPSAAEATAFSSFVFDNGFAGEARFRLCGAYTLRELGSALWSGAWPRRDVSFWTEGALAMSPEYFRRSMRARGRLRDGKRRLASAFRA